MKQYAPWIAGAVVVLSGVVFVAMGGSKTSGAASDTDEDSSGAFVPAKVVDEEVAGGAQDGAADPTDGTGANAAPSGDSNAGANGAAGLSSNTKGANSAGSSAGEEAPRKRLFEARAGAGDGGEDAPESAPPEVLPSQREVSAAQKEIRKAFTDATQKKTMECISGFVQKGKSFKGDVVIRVRVKHDAQAKDFTYDMNAIELAGTTNGRLSDFDDETYRCLWDGIGSIKTPQTPLVDDAFMGDDTLAVEVPYAIEVRGAEKP